MPDTDLGAARALSEAPAVAPSAIPGAERVESASPLAGLTAPRRVLPAGVDEPAIRLSEAPFAALWQVTAWPGCLGAAGSAAAAAAGVAEAPAPGHAVVSGDATLMRTEPLRWWLLGEAPLAPPAIDAADGTCLDLGHGRWRMRITGPSAPALLARLVAVDLRSDAPASGRVVTTPLHHVPVTLLASAEGADLFLPRSHARALWELTVETASQFGLEIV